MDYKIEGSFYTIKVVTSKPVRVMNKEKTKTGLGYVDLALFNLIINICSECFLLLAHKKQTLKELLLISLKNKYFLRLLKAQESYSQNVPYDCTVITLEL